MMRALDPWATTKDILSESTRPLELFLATVKVIWGLSLVLPLRAFSNGTIYLRLGDLASPVTWGVVMLILGVSQLFFLWLNWRRPRMLLAPFATFFWGFIAYFAWRSSPLTAGAFLTLWLALWNIWIAWRVGRTAK